MWWILPVVLPIIGFIYMIIYGMLHPFEIVAVGEIIFILTIVLSFGIFIGHMI